MSGTSKRRLEKVAVSLTPTQVVVRLLQEMHQAGSYMAYARELVGKPVSAYPLQRAGDQAQQAAYGALLRQKVSNEVRERIVRQAWKDGVFLMHVHHEANTKFIAQAETFHTSFGWLGEDLEALLLLERAEHDRQRRWRNTCAAWPFPLDQAAAEAVAATVARQVQTWASLSDDGTLTDWVADQFVREGHTALPYGAFLAQAQADAIPHRPPPGTPTRDEVRALFADDATFDQFLAGTDFNAGLTDVPDAVVAAREATVREALAALVADGTVQSGAVITLLEIPLSYLQDVPLVEGVWADRDVIALAEYGGLLAQRGYLTAEADDDHCCAWRSVLDADGNPVGSDTLLALRARATTHLARFPGRSRTIDGRPALHIADYGRWKGRLLKGKLQELESGVVVASFNAWVDAQGGEGVATLAGVPVGQLWVYGEDVAVAGLDADTAARHQQARTTLLTELRTPLSVTERAERVRAWQDRATWFLADLYSQQQAFATLSRRYFSGTPVLFPREQELLEILISVTEELVTLFNDAVAEPMAAALPSAEPSGSVDAAAVKASRGSQVQVMLNFLVDYAKSKTLDAAGESTAAHQLMERHLEQPL